MKVVLRLDLVKLRCLISWGAVRLGDVGLLDLHCLPSDIGLCLLQLGRLQLLELFQLLLICLE